MNFDLNAYYARIGLETDGSESETELLKKIHYRHITAIPFEGIEPYMGREVAVDADSVFEKLVMRRRGGYCFEQNCLIYTALRAAGLETYGVLARVAGPDGFGSHSHRMNIVTVDGVRYVADVGYGGDCFVLPLKLECDVEQSDGRNTYRIVKGEMVQYSVQIMREGRFADMLGFDDIPALDCDFELSNYYTSSNPKSGFRMFLMCARQLDNGKVTLFGRYGSVTENGKTEHFELKDDEMAAFIRDRLGVNMDGVELSLRD